MSQPVTIQLTPADVRLRETFVIHFMEDFDGYQAALRMGYGDKGAGPAATQFMQDAYVLNRIEQEKSRLGICTEEDEHRRRIVGGLYRIANDRKAAASAQVAAWGQLIKILGMEPTIRTETTLTAAPSVFEFRLIHAEDGRPVAPADAV